MPQNAPIRMTGVVLSGVGMEAYEVINITPPGWERGEIDVTHQLSTIRESIPTKLWTPTDVPFTVRWDGLYPSGQESGVPCTIKVPPAPGYSGLSGSGWTTIYFDGYIKSFQPAGDLEGMLIANVTLKITSIPSGVQDC